MQNVYAEISKGYNFYGNTDPVSLIHTYGSPLYVYNEPLLRTRCRELKNLLSYPHFSVNYAVKANSNIDILKIVKSEGLCVDTVSAGEIFLVLKAGFDPKDILYTANNISTTEMRYAIGRNIKISVDSLSQLENYGRINPGGNVVIRFNPGIGAGHHQKVITGGKKTKFGVDPAFLPEIKKLCGQYSLKVIGINQHIGSLFMDSDPYVQSMESILSIAKHFDDIEFVDLGGGFGIPYHKNDKSNRLDLNELGTKLDTVINNWVKEYGKNITVMIEPGRYIAAECGIVLGSVHAVKFNYNKKYIGTDIGFNVMSRPVLYDSHHEVEIYRNSDIASETEESVTIVGNICESGDIIAHDRMLPQIHEGDILGVLDSGAYGFSMSSNYNCRLRPAEVLIDTDGNDRLIRRRDTLEDLLLHFS